MNNKSSAAVVVPAQALNSYRKELLSEVFEEAYFFTLLRYVYHTSRPF